MKVSEQLNKAADLLRERGWIGTGGLGWEVEGGPLCIEGAIAAAIAAAMGDAIRAYGGFTTGPNLCPAGLAVREYLELGEYSAIGKGLFTWNDEAERIDGELVSKRTQAEVIEVLRAAALIEQARESERESAGVPA